MIKYKSTFKSKVLWITVGILIANIYSPIVEYFANSDILDLLIETLEGLKSDWENIYKKKRLA